MGRTEDEKEQRELHRQEQFEKLRKISYMANGASKFLKTIGRDLKAGGDIEDILERQETGAIQLMSFQDMEDLFGKDGEGGSKKKDGDAEIKKNKTANMHGQDVMCWNCDKSLYGHRFVNKEGHPYCVPCFHDKFGHNCKECKKLVEADTKEVNFQKMFWHEKCFKCCGCRKKLDVNSFASSGDEVFCSDCHDDAHADKCKKCSKAFKPSSIKLKWEGGEFHSACFCCGGCGKEIGKNPFHPNKGTPYCLDCWTENFALKCTKCTKALTSGGVTYKSEPFHRECLGCSECSRSLAGQRFTLSQKGLPLCPECFTNKHAKSCFECETPITGISGGKYLVFEGQQWHRECFYCKSCGADLAGINFLAEEKEKGLEIFCQPCGHKRRGWEFSLNP